MNRLEKTFMRLCERFHLNPSGWIPFVKVPGGIYQMATTYSKDPVENGREVPVPFFTAYELAWLWCHERREQRLRQRRGFFENLFGFAHEVSMGIYDDLDWKPVEVTGPGEES